MFAERIDTWVFNVGVAIPVVCVVGLIVWHLLSSMSAKRTSKRKAVRSAPEPPDPFAANRSRTSLLTNDSPLAPPDAERRVLARILSDTPGGTAENNHLAPLRNDPERLQRVCAAAAEVLAELYLELAESWSRRGHPPEAAAVLQKLIQSCPQTPQAEIARERLRKQSKDNTPQ